MVLFKISETLKKGLISPKQVNLKQKKHHLQFRLLKHSVMITVLRPNRSLLDDFQISIVKISAWKKSNLNFKMCSSININDKIKIWTKYARLERIYFFAFLFQRLASYQPIYSNYDQLMKDSDRRNNAQKMKFSIKDFSCKCGFGQFY